MTLKGADGSQKLSYTEEYNMGSNIGSSYELEPYNETLSVQQLLTVTKRRTDIFFKKILAFDNLTAVSNDLHTAMRYSVAGHGKRIRPALVYAAGNLLNMPAAQLDAAAASVELIHCYSLIHDDLPAMDDDDLRRGKPTCHKAFSEANAILAGDALQTLAFTVLSDAALNPFAAETRIAMVQALAHAAGGRGMVLGQAEDMSAEQQTLTLEQLISLYQRKTGALLTACIELVLCAASNTAINNAMVRSCLRQYAQNIGLAFQIYDDILDLTSTTAVLGKPQGSDQKHAKSTFPALLGLTQAQNFAQTCQQNALKALAAFGAKAGTLHELATFIIKRNF